MDIERVRSLIHGVTIKTLCMDTGRKKLDEVSASLQDYRQTFKLPKDRELRARVDYLYNYTQSIMEAAPEGDVDADEIKKWQSAAEEVLDDLDDHIRTAKVEVHPLAVVNPEEANVSRDFLADAGSHITKFARFKALMPKGYKVKDAKKVVLLKLPLVVVLNPFATEEQLTAAGFDVTMIGMYPVIEDQTVVALHKEKLLEADLDPTTYMSTVLESLRKKTGIHYDMVADEGIRYQNTGYMYYWIMPSRQLNKLITARKNGNSSIEDWGMAF